jgi:nucleotide-binding universal stress UspA family protein
MTSVKSPVPPTGDAVSETSRQPERLTSEVSPIQLKKILVPTDFSPNSEKALNYALRLAQIGQGRLLLLHVFEVPEFSALLPEASSWQLDYQEIKKTFDSAIQRAKEKLTELARRVTQEKIKVKAKVCQGTSYEEIVKVAQEEEVDLIVITTHGYTGLKHFLLGSTAERVVRVAPCPVLVVRERERDFLWNIGNEGDFGL